MARLKPCPDEEKGGWVRRDLTGCGRRRREIPLCATRRPENGRKKKRGRSVRNDSVCGPFMSELKLRPPKRRKRKAGPSAAPVCGRQARDDNVLRAHWDGGVWAALGQPEMAVPYFAQGMRAHSVEVWAALHSHELLCYS